PTFAPNHVEFLPQDVGSNILVCFLILAVGLAAGLVVGVGEMMERDVGVTTFLDIFPVAVFPSFRQDGLAKELCRRGVDHLKKEGNKHVVGLIRSGFVKKIMEDMGFASLTDFSFSKLENFKGRQLVIRDGVPLPE